MDRRHSRSQSRRITATDGALSTPPIRDDGLQIEEDRPGQERQWRLERIAHVVLLVLVVAGLLGVFGAGGPLAQGTLESAAGSVTYPRILRWETPEDMTVTFAGAAEEHTLSLGGSIGSFIILDSISPQPKESRATPDGVALTFAATVEPRPHAVITLRASRPGLADLTVQLDDSPLEPASIVVLP